MSVVIHPMTPPVIVFPRHIPASIEPRGEKIIFFIDKVNVKLSSAKMTDRKVIAGIRLPRFLRADPIDAFTNSAFSGSSTRSNPSCLRRNRRQTTMPLATPQQRPPPALL
jgi:hypothetical protein